MKTLHDYESFQYVGTQRLVEAWSGVSIVQWAGNIERQITRMLEEQEGSRNFPYADKLREFLRIWRDNEITGSINRESLEILKTASDILAVDAWNLNNYFSNLRDQLRKLLASEEQLPRVDMDQNADARGPGVGGGGGMPAMSPEFGPEGNTPPGFGKDTPPGEGTPPGDAPPPDGDSNPPGEGEEGEDEDIVPGRRMPPPPRAGGI